MESIEPQGTTLPDQSKSVSDLTSPPTYAWNRIALQMGWMVATIVVLDQLSKGLVNSWLGRGADVHHYEVIGSLVGFHYVENTGAAFGMLQGRVWVVSVLAVVVALGFLAMYRSELPRSGLLRVSVALVLGGAIGNLIDRIRLGYVIDFIGIGSFHRFNLADSSITIGLVLLVWVMLRQEWAEENQT